MRGSSSNKRTLQIPRVFRAGSVVLEALSRVVPADEPKVSPMTSSGSEHMVPQAPGLLGLGRPRSPRFRGSTGMHLHGLHFPCSPSSCGLQLLFQTQTGSCDPGHLALVCARSPCRLLFQGFLVCGGGRLGEEVFMARSVYSLAFRLCGYASSSKALGRTAEPAAPTHARAPSLPRSVGHLPALPTQPQYTRRAPSCNLLRIGQAAPSRLPQNTQVPAGLGGRPGLSEPY